MNYGESMQFTIKNIDRYKFVSKPKPVSGYKSIKLHEQTSFSFDGLNYVFQFHLAVEELLR